MHLNNHPAGWGAVVLFVPRGETEARARKLVDLFGPVVLDKREFGYLGAEVGQSQRFVISFIVSFIDCSSF